MIDPVFCLSWPEAVVADQLRKALPKRGGYSVWVPVSRQQADIDLAVFRWRGATKKSLAIQVKSSRTYFKGSEIVYDTWFKSFEVSKSADYVALVYLELPANPMSSQRRRHKYGVLLFEGERLRRLMDRCLKAKGGRDSGFGFCVMADKRILWSRGNRGQDATDYSHLLLSNQAVKLKAKLG